VTVESDPALQIEIAIGIGIGIAIEADFDPEDGFDPPFPVSAADA
jgi:hypothetical protein